jgi:hypothetical protein
MIKAGVRFQVPGVRYEVRGKDDGRRDAALLYRLSTFHADTWNLRPDTWF